MYNKERMKYPKKRSAQKAYEPEKLRDRGESAVRVAGSMVAMEIPLSASSRSQEGEYVETSPVDAQK